MKFQQRSSIELSLNQLASINSQIQYHQSEINRLSEDKKVVAGTLISTFIEEIKHLDATIPHWRVHCEDSLNELKSTIDSLSKGSDVN